MLQETWSSCHNIIDARWVNTRKLIEGNIGIKCRFTVRGFKDEFHELKTHAGTASRAGQRIVHTIAAKHGDLLLFSFDASQAFAKGMAFEELIAPIGKEIRVQFHIPRPHVQILGPLV